jgi:CMP/dCMP kinase
MIIAIDGPAGAGKGTLAQSLVKKYNFRYLDTGALFRAVAVCLLQDDNLNDENTELKAIFYSKNLDFDFTREFKIILNKQDVTSLIRDASTSMIASKIASIPQVRENLDNFQKNFAAKYKSKGVILDGRDIGTFIAPQAAIKVFLDCPAQVRATRRVEQLTDMGKQVNYDEILENIVTRDNQDRTRAYRPLKPADDAININTYEYSADDVLNMVSTQIDKKDTI